MSGTATGQVSEYAPVIRGTIWEDSGATCCARVQHNGANITQAAISSISCDLYKDNVSVSSPAVVVATSVFNTLQTDGYWTLDSTGYNFRHTIAASNFATGGKLYRAEYKFSPATGQAFWVVFEIWAKEILKS